MTQINLVVKDVAVSIAFYRRLGLPIEEANQAEFREHHATAILKDGVRLELDSDTFAKMWNPGWHSRGGPGCVIFVDVSEREAVDRAYSTAVAAGAPTQSPPGDAFWGARYAIVEDPDGNAIGIMSATDPSKRRAPPIPGK